MARHDLLRISSFCWLLGLISGVYGCQSLLHPDDRDHPLEIKGMTIFFYGQERNRFEPASFQRALEEIKETGCNMVVLVPYGFQEDERSSEIRRDDPRSIQDAEFAEACRLTRLAGLDLAVKPHIDLKNGTPRAEIDPSDFESWKSSYLDFITHFAQIAEASGASLFCVGTELTSVSGDTVFWGEVIRACRGRFRGLLTYAPTPQEALSVSFWGDLDLIGVNAYFPLSQKEDPSLADLLFGWGTWGQMIAALANEYDRPVLITEIGYINAMGVASDPGRFTDLGPSDERIQADCYRAALLASREIESIRGLIWWQWELDDPCDPKRRDYTPRCKEAEQVLKEYWR